MRRLTPWLKRGLWVAAWGCWVWLGVALHRELPRRLGEPVCRLPIDWGRETPLGFVADTNLFAIRHQKKNEICVTVDVYDPESGKRVYSSQGPRSEDFVSSIRTGRYGILVAKEHPGVDWDWTHGLHVLNLKTGQWRRLSDRWVVDGVCHPNKPWILLTDWRDRVGSDRRVVVVDWQTGKEIFVRPLARLESSNGRPFFIADSDRVAITVGSQGYLSQTPRRRMEVWTLSAKPIREHEFEEAPEPGISTESATGRIAISNMRRPACIDVYDAKIGRHVFSHPPRDERPPPKETSLRSTLPALSADGRHVLERDPQRLWEVDTGRVVWQASAVEARSSSDGTSDTMVIFESWHQLWKDWLPSLKYETEAIREFDRRLIVRTMGDVAIRPAHWNAARTLALGTDGNIYRLPLRVNWALLVVCQLVLSMPLVGFWVVLRWRRGRREKRVSAMESASAVG